MNGESLRAELCACSIPLPASLQEQVKLRVNASLILFGKINGLAGIVGRTFHAGMM